MDSAPPNRDIVVFGASTGGLEALGEIVARLPADLPAALFVVQHQEPHYRTRLPELLMQRGPLRSLLPVHGQEIAHSHIYVAPPDMHLLVRRGHVHVTRGPRENGHRPAVDALFRTAARAYGPRVIGVVLTGNMDCGTAGLLSIKARAGLALVQDPEDASAPSMPESAIRHVHVDHVAKAVELGALIAQLVSTSASPPSTMLPRGVTDLEGVTRGAGAEFSCPMCRGFLSEANSGGFVQFRCHVGHTFSLESVLGEQTEETERALWAAVRALEESATLARRMAGRATGSLRERFQEKHETLQKQAKVVRELLLGTEVGAPVLVSADETP